MDGDVVMSDLVASQPGHQSFSAQTAGDTQPSESPKLGINHFPVPYVAKATKPRPILASEWSQVERLLRHLYIEKNRTLKAVQRYLREKYALIVSEKQLTRKFSQWNLKKNFKRREREALIQECRITKDNQENRGTREGHGKAIAKKLLRWEKEIAISSKPNFQLCLKEKTGISTSIQGDRGEAKTIHASGQVEFLLTDTKSTSTGTNNLVKDHTILIAQLFAKLDLDAPADIESFYIKVKLIEETTASDSDPVPFASIHTDVPFGIKTCTTVTTSRPTSNLRLELVANQQGSPFKWDNMDVMFSTGIWVQPSPYNELCPFSAGPENAQRRFSSTVECLQSIFGTHFSPVESEFEEHLYKVEKLRQLCPVNHEGLINEMWEVAFIYCAKKEFPNAEYWSRQLAQRPLLPTAAINSQLIKSRLLLSHVLFMQGKYKEARREYRIVHQLVLGASMLAQLMLTTYGPRSEGTISALRYLSKVMLRQRRYFEAEELLWILMDLAKTNLKSTGRAVTKVTYLLAKVLYNQKRFEDAEIWWRTSLEIAQKNWGSKNSITLKAETGLAIALKAQKRLAESERLLRENLEKIIKVRGENSLTASKSMMHLGSLLMEDGRREDAVIWLEKCTKILLLGVGPTDAMAFKTFSFLTECYLQMGRYSDALKSCGEWLEAVKKVSGPGHRYVGRLETWLENIVAEM